MQFYELINDFGAFRSSTKPCYTWNEAYQLATRYPGFRIVEVTQLTPEGNQPPSAPETLHVIREKGS